VLTGAQAITVCEPLCWELLTDCKMATLVTAGSALVVRDPTKAHLFLCDFFNDSVISADCIALNDKRIMNWKVYERKL
jgi:hypothetical protein